MIAEKARLDYVDVLKCLGIFAVYLGHFAADVGSAYLFVFSYHVPLFFFMSGCMVFLSKNISLKGFIVKKVRTILIPFFIFGIASIVLTCIISGADAWFAVDSIKSLMKGAVRNQFLAGGLWFLSCLFVMQIIFEIFRKIAKDSKIALLVLCGTIYVVLSFLIQEEMVAFPVMYWNIDSALYYLIYYCMGYVFFPAINRVLQGVSELSAGKRALLVASGVYAALYSVALFFGKNFYAVFASMPLVYEGGIFTCMTALTVIWFNILVAYLLRNIKALRSIGKNCLYLCGSEYIIKELVFYGLALFGLSLSLENPLSIYLYVMLLLFLASRFLAPLEKRLFDFCTNRLPHIKK
ncbi:MAG: acyltransferase [Angelakisella sp.]